MTKLTTGMIPEQHELTSSEFIQFLKLYIPTDSNPIVIRMCLTQTLEWDGEVWPKTAFSLTGIGDLSNSERIRPKLVLANPEGLYSYYIQEKYLEGALVSYYKVHPDDLDTPQAQVYEYYINRVMEVNRKLINLQLSAYSDGNRFKLPARRFVQPEFNQVRI